MDKIAFFPFSPEGGETILISDMNPSRRLTEEDLEDGSLLKEAITIFNNERNESNLIEVMELLRDSNIWVPCTAVMGENDQKRMEELMESIS